MNVKVLCKPWRLYANIRNDDGVDFDKTKLSTNSSDRRISPEFLLIASPNNVEAATFPGGLGEHTFAKYGGGSLAFWTPSSFCSGAEPSCISGGRDWSKSSQLTSFASALLLLLWNAQQRDAKLLRLLPHPWKNAQRMWTVRRQLDPGVQSHCAPKCQRRDLFSTTCIFSGLSCQCPIFNIWES